MKTSDLLIAANTVWVVVAAVLVMFMQAGFAFLEAGLTRMKNAAHIAGKNVLIFGIASLVYWAVGFGIAFGDGNAVIGTHGFFPSTDALLSVGQAPYSFFSTIPGAGAYLFEVVFAGVSLAIVWGAMAERAKLWVYFAFGVCFTLIYSVTSHWIWHSGGWLFGLGMQDFAGSTVVHYQERLRRSRARCCSAPASASSARTGVRTRSRATTCRTRCWARSSSGSAGSASTRARR
jgi:Amt family ammonium transporter